MKKNLLLTIIAIVIVVLAGVLYFGYSGGSFQKIAQYFSGPQIDLSEKILFFGDGCPHCANVEKFVTDNKIQDKIKFTYKEVPFNGKTNNELETNAETLGQVALKCGITADKVGIPFLWDGKICIVGDVDIIKYFQNIANAK